MLQHSTKIDDSVPHMYQKLCPFYSTHVSIKNSYGSETASFTKHHLPLLPDLVELVIEVSLDSLQDLAEFKLVLVLQW